MQPILTPEEMREADRRAIAAGTTERELVARAGAAVARAAVARLGGTYGRRVTVLAGPGSNGADGIVAAGRLAALGVGADAFRIADGCEPTALMRALDRSDLVIDAMYGTGFRDALTGPAATAADAVAAAGLPVLAVDVPSGVDGLTGAVRGPAVRADTTVCFAALKPGLCAEPGRSHAGRVRVVDIGIDPGPVHLHAFDDADLVLPDRAADAHKWANAVLVVGGSPGLTGAPRLAAAAAARTGAGMVVCAVPGAEAAAALAGGDVVTRALPADAGMLSADAAPALLADAERFGALVIGPGLGRGADAATAARALIAGFPGAVVVDADAIVALAADPTPLRARVAAGFPAAVLTPHGGEYARLAGHRPGPDRVAAARTLAARLDAIVLLKGPGTVTARPDGEALLNRTDSADLATAGTGDVLAGIIGGLLAGDCEPFGAAATAAHLHGLAARRADLGPALVASDLVAALAPTLADRRVARRSEEG
ncbi:MAG: NAD(P)H-hydrate dehydratase [Actinomycetota bacterium]